MDTEKDPMCEDEVRLLQRFNGHDHIVCLHEVYSEQGAVFFSGVTITVVSWWFSCFKCRFVFAYGLYITIQSGQTIMTKDQSQW